MLVSNMSEPGTAQGFMMKHSRMIISIIIVGMTVLSLFFTGCDNRLLTSRWREREITIDGQDPEWGNFIQYYNEKYNIELCLFNDENYLYLKLSSPERIVQQRFLAFGFTVWFDPEGGKNKTLGIHFPKGMHSGTQGELRFGGRNERNSDEVAREKALKGELDILGPDGKDSRTFPVDDAEKLGIKADFGTSGGILIYELQIPLRKNERNNYAIGVPLFNRGNINAPIGIGFETGALDKEQLKKQGGEEGDTISPGLTGGGGIPGGAISRNRSREGSSGLTGRGGAPGEPRRMLETIDMWVKVMLAPKP